MACGTELIPQWTSSKLDLDSFTTNSLFQFLNIAANPVIVTRFSLQMLWDERVAWLVSVRIRLQYLFFVCFFSFFQFGNLGWRLQAYLSSTWSLRTCGACDFSRIFSKLPRSLSCQRGFTCLSQKQYSLSGQVQKVSHAFTQNLSASQ